MKGCTVVNVNIGKFVSTYFACAAVSHHQSKFRAAQAVRAHAQKMFEARCSLEEVNTPCCRIGGVYSQFTSSKAAHKCQHGFW